MTKLNVLLENLVTIIERDTDLNICKSVHYMKSHYKEPTLEPGDLPYLCVKISCNECIFHRPTLINNKKRLLQIINTLELLDVDS